MTVLYHQYNASNEDLGLVLEQVGVDLESICRRIQKHPRVDCSITLYQDHKQIDALSGRYRVDRSFVDYFRQRAEEMIARATSIQDPKFSIIVTDVQPRTQDKGDSL